MGLESALQSLKGHMQLRIAFMEVVIPRLMSSVLAQALPGDDSL